MAIKAIRYFVFHFMMLNNPHPTVRVFPTEIKMAIDDRRFSLLLVGMALVSLPVAAQETRDSMRTGRYSTVTLGPTAAQTDPLQARVHRRLPDSIQTVGEALDFVLIESGYRRAPAYAADPAMGTLLPLPLPEVHRELGPLSLRAILIILAGPTYRLITDPVHRLVSFELKPSYRSLDTEASAPLNPGWTVIDRPEMCSPGNTRSEQRDLTVTYERRCDWLSGDSVCCPKTHSPSPPPPVASPSSSKIPQETRSHVGFNNK